MKESNLIGRCGLYCGACLIYRAERDSEELRNKIASKHNCSSSEVRCSGCGSLAQECWGNGCRIVLCTRSKGVDHCFECGEHGSCEKFENLSRDYLEAGVDLKANLQMISEGNIEKWLEESKTRYTCRSCGKPVAVWTDKCHHCGCTIEK